MARQGSTSSGVKLQLSFKNIGATVARIHSVYDDDVLPAARAAVAKASGRVKAITQATVPIDTAFMHDHVEEVISEDGLSFEVGWRESAFAAAGHPFYPVFVEFGTVKMQARPSLGPAYAEVKPQFQSDVSTLVRQAIARRNSGGT